MIRLAIAAGILLLSLSSGARADVTFDWNFASSTVGPSGSSAVSGSGTLTAIDEGNGTFFITGGSGTVNDATYGSFAVAFAACTYLSTCVLNTPSGSSDPNYPPIIPIQYDNLIAPGNPIGYQLIGSGIALVAPSGASYTDLPPGSGAAAISLSDPPSSLSSTLFYSLDNNNDPYGFDPALLTPFNVTLAPVPGPTVGAGLSSFVLAALFLGWFVRRRSIPV